MRTLFLAAVLLLSVVAIPAAEPDTPTGTIAFSSIGPRGWDLYITDIASRQSRRLTDHPALDYNAVFSPTGDRIAFVSERDGNLELYCIQTDGTELKRLTNEYALDDHPAWSPDGRQLVFVSTRQPAEKPGQAWNGLYIMNADSSEVRRLSGTGAADYSPAWSPRGDAIAFASGSGVRGGTDLYVIKPDGSDRRLVIKNGGWPTFAADGQSIYFHSGREDKWGIWQVRLDGTGLERITPPDIEAYTPRSSADGTKLVLAVKRGTHRQIELLDLASRQFTPVTQDATDHWNPSLAPDGRSVVYHQTAPNFTVPNVELWGTPPGTRLRLLRPAGAFPAFAPDGKRLALTGGGFATVDVMNLDGSERKTIFTGKNRGLFSISWAHTGDLIAFSEGGVFQGPQGGVDLVTLHPDGSEYKKRTTDLGNNGFPSFSPDGQQVVFRSGRGGNKNLFIMNRDSSGSRQLTDGKWTDTMCDWSPTNEWIAFASDRGGNFEVWLIKPDGSGLRKLIGGGGRHNHPHFSPDGRWIVFTSQRAGYSAEEVSLPSQPQPYGDLFIIRLDGTGLLRLTHNGFEEGTPAWGPVLEIKPSGQGRKAGGLDY